MTDGQMPRIASLGAEEEKLLRDVEKQLGNVYVIAYEQPLVPARLADDELEVLQEAEQKMPGVVLVAYRKAKQPVA